MTAFAWLHDAAMLSIAIGAASALIIAVDEIKRPQMMWIMNAVWPLTALFGTVFTLWAYFRYGRATPKHDAPNHHGMTHQGPGGDSGHHHARNQDRSSFPVKVGKGTLHCGSGCTLGDIVAEWLAFLAPVVAVWFGWRWLFETKMFAVWILDYVLAFTFGIAFQYFTIKPMRELSAGRALVEAVKADTASLTAWQIGMYGFMAFAHFSIFPRFLGIGLTVNSVEFWLAMQIAMLWGLATSYPVNWWLIRKGVKEAM
ncbi:MAG: DUF4396 domain-containing protein [Rhodospirillales bacterium]|nr:DUF4396 domain-containing protein [Rhodospirillales bacterium]